MKTPSRGDIDGGGVMAYFAWKNSSGETIVIDNRTITLIGDNNWEEQSFTLTPPTNATTLIIGWGLARNGTIYIAENVVSYDDGLTRANVYIRKSDTAGLLDVYDASGVKIGSLSLS